MAARDIAIKGVESALCDAVSKVGSMYQTCLVDAGGDAAKEAGCKAILDHGLGYANKAYVDMLAAVNRQTWG